MRTSGSTTCSSALPNSGGIFDAAKPEQELARLEAQASAPDFWNNQVEAQKVLQRRRRLDEDVTLLTSLRQRSDDLTVLREWLEAGEPVGDDLMRGLDALGVEVEAGEIKKMLGGEHDTKNAIITVHPGAGGTESQDWAEMILRMYLRWAERRGFQREVLDFQPGDEAGVKSATPGGLRMGRFSSSIGCGLACQLTVLAKSKHSRSACSFRVCSNDRTAAIAFLLGHNHLNKSDRL